MHRIPKPAVAEHPGFDGGESVRCGGLPPLREAQLGRGSHDLVQRGQPQILAHRRARVATASTDDGIDDPGHVEADQDLPDRGRVTEPAMLRVSGQRRDLTGVMQLSMSAAEPR